MTRLADYVKADPEALAEETFEFPAQASQPTVSETTAKMARVVAFGQAEEFDPEDEVNLPPELVIPIVPPRHSIRDAFDAGYTANLRMPPIPDSPGEQMPPKSTRRKPAKAASGRPSGSDQLTDLFAAGMITLIAFTAGDEFQPTEEEAHDLSRPLGNIMARRIDLATKLGQDSNDVIAFAIAVMAYGVRVGPVAGERMRTVYADRQRRSRADRVTPDRRPANGGNADSVFLGSDAGAGSENGTPGSALDALAATRNAQYRVVERDLGAATTSRPRMAANG